MDNNNFVEASPLPSVSSFSSPYSLYSFYLVVQDKPLFKRIYIAVWRKLFSIAAANDGLYLYYYYSAALRHDNLITLHQFIYLSRLIYLCGGRGALDIHKITPAYEYHNHITNLVKRGFVSRSRFNPLNPSIVGTFISITPSGLRYYKNIVGRCRVMAANDLMNHV